MVGAALGPGSGGGLWPGGCRAAAGAGCTVPCQPAVLPAGAKRPAREQFGSGQRRCQTSDVCSLSRLSSSRTRGSSRAQGLGTEPTRPFCSSGLPLIFKLPFLSSFHPDFPEARRRTGPGTRSLDHSSEPPHSPRSPEGRSLRRSHQPRDARAGRYLRRALPAASPASRTSPRWEMRNIFLNKRRKWCLCVRQVEEIQDQETAEPFHFRQQVLSKMWLWQQNK